MLPMSEPCALGDHHLRHAVVCFCLCVVFYFIAWRKEEDTAHHCSRNSRSSPATSLVRFRAGRSMDIFCDPESHDASDLLSKAGHHQRSSDCSIWKNGLDGGVWLLKCQTNTNFIKDLIWNPLWRWSGSGERGWCTALDSKVLASRIV